MKYSFTTFYLFFDLFKIIKPKYQRKLFYCGFLAILSAFADIFSVASIIPLLSLLNASKPLDISSNQFFEFILINLYKTNLYTPVNIVIFFSFTALLSGLLRLINLWYSSHTSGLIASDIGSLLLRKILNVDYEYFLSHNSSNLVTALTFNIQSIFDVINSSLKLFSSIILSLILITSLFIYDLYVAIIIFILFSFIYLLIYFSTKKRLNNNSYRIFNSRKHINTILKEAFISIRDILIHNSSSIVVHKYSKYEYPLRQLIVQNLALSISPKFIIESLSFVFISCLSLFLIYINNSDNAIEYLGLLAIGGIKLLPAFQLVYASLSIINGNLKSVREVLTLLNKLRSNENILANPKDKLILNTKIQVKNVSFIYNGSNIKILKNISFELSKGESLGIIGSTGSGKSTLIDIIIGFLRPTQGSILVNGINLNNSPDNLKSWQTSISHVPQSIFLSDTSFYHNIAFGVPTDQIDYSLVHRVSDIAQISSFIQSLPSKYSTNVGELGVRLSGGQRQRVGIARALYKQSSLLILDEATSALDTETEQIIINAISNIHNITLIMISHRLSTLKRCNKIIKVINGNIIPINCDQLV